MSHFDAVFQDKSSISFKGGNCVGFGEIAKNLANKDNDNKVLLVALKEIESLTRNPREYEPSLYTINHIARTAIKTNEDI